MSGDEARTVVHGVDANFRLALMTAALFVACLLVLQTAIAMLVASPTTPQSDLLALCADCTSVGVGAVFGLVGGRAVIG